jgi:hypothetical protein
MALGTEPHHILDLGAYLLDAAPLLGVAAAVLIALWTERRDARYRRLAQRASLQALAHDLTALAAYLRQIRNGTGTPFPVVQLSSLPAAIEALGTLAPAGAQAVFDVQQRIGAYNAVTNLSKEAAQRRLDSTVEAIDAALEALVALDVTVGVRAPAEP